jgi:acyl-CoA synthetase (AMP-forming)/AMP-acid ligase II
MSYDPTKFRNFFEHEFSYEAGFRRNVSRFANATAIIDPPSGRTWTYRQLGADANRLAAALAALGIDRGDRVVYQLFNSVEFALTYLAGQRLAAVGVPINYRLAPAETAHILRDSTPAVFVYDHQFADVTEQALKLADASPRLIVVGAPEKGEILPGAIRFEDALTGSDAELPAVPADFSIYEESTRLYTSGTTGMPKGVPLPSLVEVMTAHDVIMHLPLTPYDRTLNMTPWFHRGGLYPGGPSPVFYVGGSVVPMRAFDAPTVLDWVEKYQLTFLVGAPATLAMLADEQERTPRDLSTLHGIVTMGSPLERAAAIRYQTLLTPRIFNGYGTTEAFWNTFLRPEDLPERAGSAGRACTDDDVAVVKVFPDRRAHPDELVARDGSEAGEIIMRSPKAGYAYLNLPEKEEEKFFEGWLYPGDIAVWDEDSFVTILGRKDDMIISGGENVHPVQVEEAIADFPGVADSIVVGLPDDHWGERIVAYVVRKGDGVTAGALDEHLKNHERLANFKRPRAYRFIDSLPMTATGKKMHYKLKEQAFSDNEAGLFEHL